MQITRSRPNTFQNRRIFRERNNITLAELPKFIGQTLVLTYSLRVESLHTLFVCCICRSTSVSTGTSNKQILSTKSRMWWSQSRRHGDMVVTDPKTMLKPPQVEIWNTANQLFCQFLQCQAPVHKRKPPLLKAFWWRFWVERRYTAQHNWARLKRSIIKKSNSSSIQRR